MQSLDLKSLAESCHAATPESFIDKCTKLYELITEYNRTTNVTRITSEAEFWSKHVADSLFIGQYFPRLANDSLSLADIGCGAGFPALIIAAAFPNIQVTAVDSIGKKTAFVKLAAEALQLNNIQVVTARSKEMTHMEKWREQFDVVTARAVADARKLFRETRTLLKADGQFIFYKTPKQLEADYPEVSKAAAKYGITWETTEVFELPDNGGNRQFLYSERS